MKYTGITEAEQQKLLMNKLREMEAEHWALTMQRDVLEPLKPKYEKDEGFKTTYSKVMNDIADLEVQISVLRTRAFVPEPKEQEGDVEQETEG